MGATASWYKLPMEMKMAIVDVVSDPSDVKALSFVDHTTHNASLHALYKVRGFPSAPEYEMLMRHLPAERPFQRILCSAELLGQCAPRDPWSFRQTLGD